MGDATSVKAIFEKLVEDKQPTGQDKGIIKKMAGAEVNFEEKWTYADIGFVVENKTVYASKMILIMWSPVFEAMFRNNFKEKNAQEIQLPGKSFGEIKELMKVLHPPNKEICSENVLQVLPLAQEYQIDVLTERCEDFLMSQASSIKNYLIALRFGLKNLEESNMAYLKRAPISRLKAQPEFDTLDHHTLLSLLTEKCLKFETHLDELRDVRMVLERKKPTSFPGMHLLCDSCTSAREQQVDCPGCMRGCCNKITEILRSLER